MIPDFKNKKKNSDPLNSKTCLQIDRMLVSTKITV